MLEVLVLPPGFNQGVMKTEPRLGGALIIRITDFITRTERVLGGILSPQMNLWVWGDLFLYR